MRNIIKYSPFLVTALIALNSGNVLAQTTTTTWTKCANEGGVCKFSGTKRVRYGLNGVYAVRTATTSIQCNNNVFGDPVYGSVKVCEVEGTTTTSASTSTATASSTLMSAQSISEDMSKAHESTVHGINPAWDWGSAPRQGAGTSFPSTFSDPNFVPWGIAATATAGSPATNTRVQLRKIILDVKRNGKWSRVVYNTDAAKIMGALYLNYETNQSSPANLLKHGTDGISVKLPSTGGSFHFMTTNRFPIAAGAQEIVSRVEARLIVDDASKADDRAKAKLLVNSGGDIWKTASAQWNPSVLSNVDFAIGRFKYVTNDWKVFSSSTLTTTAEVNDYLANEPVLSPR